MGKRSEKNPNPNPNPKSKTLPSSPTHSFSSSSSSDFEFTISLSPRKSSANLIPADELFYKGQILPLQLSPRISMVRTLLLASSSISSNSDSTTTASRDSSGSSNDSNSFDCDSSRPSSATEDEEFKRIACTFPSQIQLHPHQIKKSKYFSLSRFSSVFRKEVKSTATGTGTTTTTIREVAETMDNGQSSSKKRMSATAKEVFRKYMKKVKPLYERLSQKQQQQQKLVAIALKAERTIKEREIAIVQIDARKDNINGRTSHSFSGNLRYPRKKSVVSSCPSSMRSSPTHSGVLSRNGFKSGGGGGGTVRVATSTDSSSMEELQSAIQGAIAHCKNSMLQN